MTAVDLDAGMNVDDTTPNVEPANGRPRSNLYPDVFAFLTGFLADVYAREVHDQRRDFRWCAQWFHHPEAIARLEAVWKAWEVLRLDPGTGAGIWFRDFLDPAMTALTAPEGPFARCTETRHQPPTRLPLATPPAGVIRHHTADAAAVDP